MDLIHQFVDQNMQLLIFLYGLSFFMLGVVCAIQYQAQSKIKLMRSLWVLSLFGLIHGLAEWGNVFIPYQTPSLTREFLYWVDSGQLIILISSFAVLFQFGVSLLADDSIRARRVILALPGLVFGCWVVAFLAGSKFEGPYSEQYLLKAEVIGRYLFAVPGAILSGIGLIVQSKNLSGSVLLKARSAARNASVTFYVYAVFSGVVVPRSTFFPADRLNMHIFHEVFGLPVEFYRMITIFFMTYYIFRLLECFEDELTGRLEWAECQYSVLNERLRISRDLHDGILQSVYALGLRCENMKHLVEADPENAKKEIDSSLRSFNQLIGEIRTYIGALRVENYQEKTLYSEILNVVKDFPARTQILIDYDIDDLTSFRICPRIADQVVWVVREAMNNVARHSEASKVIMEAQNGKHGLWLKISDNGKGFRQQSNLWRTKFSLGHQGISNMRDRAKLLGGELEIRSKLGEGTTVSLYVPREGLNQACGGGITCGCESQTYSSYAR